MMMIIIINIRTNCAVAGCPGKKILKKTLAPGPYLLMENQLVNIVDIQGFHFVPIAFLVSYIPNKIIKY